MYRSCKLCARQCSVDRLNGQLGYCKMSATPRVARAALHMWEEPPISGTRGSGTIFFSGCSLGCIYCQNRAISRGECGAAVTEGELAEIMLSLERQGAHNINFVTPTHFVPSVIEATDIARSQGLNIPIVYNTSAFETKETIKALGGTVNIWLPDLKYYRPETARAYSSAPDLPAVAFSAIEEMVKQKPEPKIDREGIMQSGVIVRLLLLPGHLAEAKLNLSRLYRAFGDSIYISLMSQYTPPSDIEMPPPLDRRVTTAEYDELVDFALAKGVKNAFIQDKASATESFTPTFDMK